MSAHDEALLDRFDLSFEFFPPKTPDMERRLWQAIASLAPLGPRFVSVTYGAGGTTRDRTHATVARIRNETGLEPAAHLTCVGATAGEIDEVARRYWQAGIRHIVALRGDPPEGLGQRYVAYPGGYAYAADLVHGLKRVGDFEISVAAFPETHPEATGADADLDNLKRKVDAGAARAITQYFFDPDVFFRFRDRAQARGIAVPIVPGLLPIANFAQAVNFSQRCGAHVPAALHRRFAGLADDPAGHHAAAIEVAAAMILRLVAGGANSLHIYTLNRAELTHDICAAAGILAAPPARARAIGA
ncbi:MAG: methylenetetrahydrofolate reductase [NAD(P)H] [Alphaproteobacteria bacterium]|nr:methylenetetrahydrofolate reductase [NAD(P)H] [Alphaproteobacteria bacterium]